MAERKLRVIASAMPTDSPLSTADFAELMTCLAPFEAAPRLAIAVSGGADSLALTLLAECWARDRGGSVMALTVDHALRLDSAAEARQVTRWLATREISHKTLRWASPVAAGGVQAAARDARYDLLTGFCRDNGILHLLVAHHREDQAETVLLRLARGSGPDGLAAMAKARPLAGVRLLRPLLDVPAARLRATLAAAGQDWIDDPSNQDAAYARVRVRRALAQLPAAGIDAISLSRLAAAAAESRAELDQAVADFVARGVDLYPAGYAIVHDDPWRAAPLVLRRAVLSALLTSIGGGAYPPRRNRVSRLLVAMADGRGGTLAGCRAINRRGHWLLVREAGRQPAAVPLMPGETARWDRFSVRLNEGKSQKTAKFSVGALGAAGWQEIARDVADPLPAPVRATLPALRAGRRLLAVPHLGWCARSDNLRNAGFSAIFVPKHPVVKAGLRVA